MFYIKQAGANLLSIINDILDFSRIEKGQFVITSANYQVSSLIDDVISIIRIRAYESELHFIANIDANLPVMLFGDEIRIRQAILNLLGNAVKYTDEGFVSISATGEYVDDNIINLLIQVEDSGRGIKEEDIVRLFDEFTQFDLEKNKGVEGTGLGLAITRNIVEAMGGTVSVTSEYGKGSIFTIQIPQEIRGNRNLASIENIENRDVLLIEPCEIYMNSIVCTMDNLNVSCKVVSSVNEYINELKKAKYSFAFMPLEFCNNVRERLAETKSQPQIVILTNLDERVPDNYKLSITYPVYSVPVANIINGAHGIDIYTGHVTKISFIAPDASILVVDDINTNLRVAEGLIRPYMMNIDLRNNGIEAIEALKEKRYDLIMMDHMMPGISGVEATAKIRALGNDYHDNVPIIAMTANAVTGAREMFLDSGFSDCLFKPINIPELDNILKKWIPVEKQIDVEYT